MVSEGDFREDLFYRLNVLTLRVPPLRERREDIPLLVRHFTRPGAKGDGLRFTDDALEALKPYHFPGNVRELQNLVERLAILHAPETIESRHVHEVLAMTNGKPRAARSTVYQFGVSLKDLMRDVERQILIEAISAHGNKGAAAVALGTERSHFYKKCRQYGIAGSES
jgi:two-component system nitrogen regulation response regulator NtrX